MVDGGHQLIGAPADRHWRVVRVQRQADVRLLCLRDNGFEEVLSPFQLFGARMRADALLGRQALRQLVVVGGVPAPARPFSSL